MYEPFRERRSWAPRWSSTTERVEGLRARPQRQRVHGASNRRNPDKTDVTGHFGWDVLTGRYKVRVTKKGCFKPKNKKVAFVDSREMDIPPPVTNLDLRLDCPDKVKPKLSAIKVKDRVLSVKVSEAATVKALLERCAGKRCRRAKAFTIKAKFSKVLTFKVPKAVKAGRYRATATATDLAKNKARPLRGTLRVK